jgi:hypothetical protein
MNFNEHKYWLDALVRTPGIIKWYFHWRSSLNGQSSPLHDELPWITYGTIDWLNRHLTKNMTVFEWGSGGSTMFFAQRVKQVITIEHDPLWYQDVTNVLEMKRCKNILLRLVEPEPSKIIDTWYTTTDARYVGFSFERYVKMIDEYSDGYFDVVFVDGRARPGCMKHAISKIKNGGYLILDNSERTEYKAGWNLVQEWNDLAICGPGPYSTISTETRIWQKKSH